MSLTIVDAAFTAGGEVNNQSKESIVASSIPTKDVVISSRYPQVTSDTDMYSSSDGMRFWRNNLASSK
ncbi:hypothetical protein PS2_009824 [Malus domestica]